MFFFVFLSYVYNFFLRDFVFNILLFRLIILYSI